MQYVSYLYLFLLICTYCKALEIYNKDAIIIAKEERKRFSHELFFHVDSIIQRLYTEKDKTDIEADHIKFDALGPIANICKYPIESYGVGDGEKRACGLLEQSKTQECVIYSIGSNNEWEFEEAIYEKTNCTVHTFDCTVDLEKSQPPIKIRDRVKLYPYCIGSRDMIVNGMQFLTYDSIHEAIKVKTLPIYLKIDIEGFEYNVLKALIDSRSKTLPDQIALEIHMTTIKVFIEHAQLGHNHIISDTDVIGGPGPERIRGTGEIALFMDYLWRSGGYYLIDRHDNEECTLCSEILLAKIGHF